MTAKKSVRLLAGTALTALVLASPALADSNVEQTKGSSPETAAVEQLRLAGELVRLGMKNNDPLTLIVAARITNAAGPQQQDRTKESTTGQDEQAAKTGNEPPETAAEILALAKKMAGDRQDIAALIKESEAPVTRGLISGPAYHRDRVRAYGVDVYRLTFRGREPAALSVRGDGDTDLDLYVYDQNGNLICADTNPWDSNYCQWTPRWTGPFIVKIENHGRVSNRYVLITN